MKIINDIEEFKLENRKIHLALGNFDGIHLGHNKVIENAIDNKEMDSEVWILTFNPHPSKLLKTKEKIKLINTKQQQINLFSSKNINGLILQPFNETIMNYSPVEFFNKLKSKIPLLSGVYVGDNWVFGKNRSGNIHILKTLCDESKINFIAQKNICIEGDRISSSRIRKEINKGEMQKVYELLGRYYSITGKVIHGEKIGRSLGFPTANINSDNECIPTDGIYAAKCIFKDNEFNTALYIGTRKTLHDDNKRVIEAHLINKKDINLYNEEVEIKIIKFIRKDEKYETRKKLQEQISNDVSNINKILNNLK